MKKAKGIGGALTRKFGPLPAWAWAALLFVGVWYYRNKLGAAASGTGTGSVGPSPVPPQAQTVLQPGESLYDPNTGALTTAPGGGDVGGTGGGGTGQGNTDIASLAQALEDAITANEGAQQPGQPDSSAAGDTSGNPAPTTNGSGRVKRAAKKVTKRTKKPKAHHKPPGKHPAKPHDKPKTRPRSRAHVNKHRNKSPSASLTFPGHRTRAGAKPHATKPKGSGRVRRTPVRGAPTVRARPEATATPKRRLTPEQIKYIEAGTRPVSRPRLTAAQIKWIRAGTAKPAKAPPKPKPRPNKRRH